ncbi:DedA family protein [Candidatus Dependentiae bacterium]|nr:MAG: DedA family protein [Candidatus Dependentiae bacterium]
MKKVIKILLILSIAILVFLSIWYIKNHLIELYYYVELVKIYLQSTVKCCPAKAIAIYSSIYVLCAIFAVPVLMPLTLFGGMLFGTMIGSVAAIVSSTVGALISFLLIKKFLLSFMSMKYQHVTQEMSFWIGQRGVFTALIILHFLTVVPYVIINTIAALLGVSVPLFIATSLFGSAPVMVVYAFAGSQFTTLNSVSDIFSPTFLIACMLLLCFLLLPSIFYKYK